ncbi:MAG: hypothetical protein RIB54_08105 [Fulvivirga sp.]|uniref:hypothetical protein n=3 Tax=Fulvivirga sp. TaxID=1931237 RepID=UPI0032EDF2F3
MKRISIYLLAVMTLVATGCGDDDESGTSQLGVNQAKESMNDFSEDLASDIIDITQAEGLDAIGDLFSLTELSDPFGGRLAVEGKSKWFKEKAIAFKSIFIPKHLKNGKSEDAGFDFQENVGVYNWNFDEEIFEKTSSSGQIIVINFPTEGSITNNAQLRITAYEDELFEDEFEEYAMPTTLAVDLAIANVKLVEINFSADYNNEGVPTEGAVSIFLKPYTFTVAFDDSNATSTSGSFSLKSESETLINSSATIVFLSNEKDEVKTLEGMVTYRTMKLEGDIDVEGIESAGEVDYNDFITLALFDNNAKVGDIVFVTEIIDEEEDDIPYIQYADGSKQRLEDVFDEAIDELEEFETEIEDWGN